MPLIRPATVGDVQAIAQIHVEGWRSAYRHILPTALLDSLSQADRQEQWQATLREQAPNEFILVVEQEGQVVGFASGGPERKNDLRFTGEVYALYLLSEQRGQGTGTLLFRQSMAALLARGLESMKVWALKDNPYRSFYERHGGQLVEEGTTRIAGIDLPEVAYGWPDLRQHVE
jgi:L-amino acid N-acyltransferase YncA